jgi:DNA-binding transcriptional MerR regulator
MKEEQIKRLKDFLKSVHGFSENQIEKFLSADDTTNEAIETAKSKITDSYDEGLDDGVAKAKKEIVTAFKKELGISITDKDFQKIDLGIKNIIPKLEEKFKTSDAPEESEVIRTWKTKYDTMVAEKDGLIEEAKNSAQLEVFKIKRESIAVDFLKTGGFKIPENKEELDTKLQMVESIIEKRGYKYQQDKDGVIHRISEDGTKVRANNKNVTYQDDLTGLYQITFGKSVADGKDGGIGNDAGGSESGGGQVPELDWSKIKSKGFEIPKSKEEAYKALGNPLLDIDDKVIVRDYMEAAETK